MSRVHTAEVNRELLLQVERAVSALAPDLIGYGGPCHVDDAVEPVARWIANDDQSKWGLEDGDCPWDEIDTDELLDCLRYLYPDEVIR